MGVGKIIQLVGVLVAIVVGLISEFAFDGTIVAILGVAGGWFISADNRTRFLIATIALIAVQGALGVIPEVGQYIDGAMGGLAALFSAGALTVILVATFEELKP